MLLEHYHGVAVDLAELDPSDSASVKRVSVKEWCYFSGSHVCPKCVEENLGVWQLAWKLPWTFACEKHSVLLIDTCPGCLRRPGASRQDGATRPRFVSRVPYLDKCMNAKPDGTANPGLSSSPCEQPLADIEVVCLVGYPDLLEVQTSINNVLNGAIVTVGGLEVSSLDYFTDLRSLCSFILYAAKSTDLGNLPAFARASFLDKEVARHESIETRGQLDNCRQGPHTRVFTAAPKSSSLMAALLPVATHILRAPDSAEVAKRMRWLVVRGIERKQNQVRQLARYLNFSPRLEEAFDKCLEPRKCFVQVFEDRVSKDEAFAFSADHVPQLLWLEVYQRSFKTLLPNIGEDYGRRVCSMALVRLSGDYTWREAAEALELPPKPAVGMATKVVGVLEAGGHAETFTEHMRDLALRLSSDPKRVNYVERRRALSDFTEIVWKDWRAICSKAGIRIGKKGGRNRYAAVWLWCYLTEGDFRLSPGLQIRSSANGREVYSRFLQSDLPNLTKPLKAYAHSISYGSTLSK